jgi:molybdopterin-guanine dinucleotide biosynthesis protein A
MKPSGWTGVVLAGGRSTRMGRDKALLPWGNSGRTLLDHALDRLSPLVNELVVVGDPRSHGSVGPFVIPDDLPGQGPLGGLVTAMRYATHDGLLVLAVDMPGATGALLMALQAGMGHFTDVVVPRHGDRLEPLCAAYHRRCRPVFEALLASGERRMRTALDQVRCHRLDSIPGSLNWPADLFRNLNRPEDLE